MAGYSLSSLNNSNSRIIKPSRAWDDCLTKLSSNGLEDIYFDHRYLSLYVDSDSEALVEAFIYEKNNDIFFLPYIRNIIPGSKNLWDFETAYGYSGPIATSESKSFLNSAWKHFAILAKGLGIIVGLIRFHPLLNNDRFAKNSPVKILYESDTVWLDCKRSLNNVIENYSKKHLKRLYSLEKKGVNVYSSNSPSDLYEFSKIYLNRMTKLGARDEYHFDKEYFKNIIELGNDRWKVYLAYTPEDKIMGGCLLLFSEKFCHYHLSGSIQEHLKWAPNDVLRHSVIKEMLNSKYNAIHFGGGRTNSSADSLLLFKLKFSQQKCSYKVGGLILDNETYGHICKQWEIENLDKKYEFNDFLLKYRY
jgi:hypothetical protein